MSGHWRLAVWCAARVLVLGALVGVGVLYYYGEVQAAAFGYGVGVGVLSFVSTAATVSLLTRRRSKVAGVLLGAFSFVARYGFAAAALGVPAYLGLWPVVAMLIGFAGVYFAETIVLVPWSLRSMSFPRHELDEGAERKVEV